ncbi:MAG: hydroxymethylbilane synthase [Anaerolineaceae bacterium]|nr:hydroxymethylbilane synthase [Anaerolineaceae bacterium]
MTIDHTLRIGTRGSRLALWQAQHARALLQRAWPGLDTELVVIRSQGDRQSGAIQPPPGGGFFTAALTEALREGDVDLAVHSLKDLPTAAQPGLTIGAIPRRGAVADVLVSRDGLPLARLPMGAVIGTGSPRRVAQLLHHRPDLAFIPVRGNVHTRVWRLLEAGSPCDALVLAEAGLVRLGLESCISERLALDLMLPAPGQGALALQCRDEDSLLRLLAPLDHAPTRQAVNAERSFLASLASGCSAPVASLATVVDDRLQLRGRVLAREGSRMIELTLEESTANDRLLGERMAQLALREGAASLVAGP